MTLEIHQMLVVSTGHVSEETADRLPRGHADMVLPDESITWLPTFARDEGWVFYVGDDLERFKDAPEDPRRVADFASARGCVWLMFDNDGPRVDGLPWWEW